MGAIRLGILNCVLIGIIGASEVVTFAEKCLNAGQHMVIFDDNIKGMYIGRGSGDKKKRQVAFFTCQAEEAPCRSARLHSDFTLNNGCFNAQIEEPGSKEETVQRKSPKDVSPLFAETPQRKSPMTNL